jgi:hypothetical protein
MAKLRRESDSSLDDDASLLLMARQNLGGPTDDGRAPYQIALTVCDECGRGRQQGRGELIEVGADIVEMAQCDAQSWRFPLLARLRNSRDASHTQYLTTLELLGFLKLRSDAASSAN